MKTLFSTHKWMRMLYGLLLLIAGVVIIVIALVNENEISTWLSIVIAIALFVYSSVLIFSGIFSLKDKVFDPLFIYGVIFVAIGVSLLVKPEIIGSFIIIFIASLLCAAGVVELGEATAMIYFKRKKALIVMFYTLGAILITLGVLTFSFQPQVGKIIYVGTGGIFCVAALFELGLGLHSILKNKGSKKEKKKGAIDAPAAKTETEKTDA